MENRPFGIPMPVLLIGGGILVYFLFFRGSSSSASGGGSPSTGGGGGTITTGNTQIQKGAVTITVSQAGQPQGPGNKNKPPVSHNPQPKPPVHPRKKIMQYKVNTNPKLSTLSLAAIAKAHHSTPQAIIQASTGPGNPHGPAFNAYVKRGNWNAPLPHGTNLDIPG